MIKAIIFDFGGPIVDWEAGMNAVYRKHEDHHNLERDTLHDFFDTYIKGGLVADFHSVADFIEKTKPAIDLTIEELNEILEEANAHMFIRPEMIEYIVELKKKYRIALLSNFTVGLEKFLQDVFKIYHLFDLVLSSYNLKIRKPDAQIYEHTLKQLGVQPDEVVFIDDLKENIKGAEAIGIKGILFKSVDQCKADLNKLLS